MVAFQGNDSTRGRRVVCVCLHLARGVVPPHQLPIAEAQRLYYASFVMVGELTDCVKP